MKHQPSSEQEHEIEQAPLRNRVSFGKRAAAAGALAIAALSASTLASCEANTDKLTPAPAATVSPQENIIDDSGMLPSTEPTATPKENIINDDALLPTSTSSPSDSSK